MDGQLDAELAREVRAPRTGGEDHLTGRDRADIGLDPADPAAVALERPGRGALDDPRAVALGCGRERPDVPARVDLCVERAVRGGHHRVGQDRRDRPRLVSVEQPHRDAVGRPAFHELAHDGGLGLVRDVDEAAVGPQAEVGAQLLGESLEHVPRVHHELELRPGPSGVDPDVAEVPAGRPGRELVRLEQDHRRTPFRELVGRRRADDPATDHQHVRRFDHEAPSGRNARSEPSRYQSRSEVSVRCPEWGAVTSGGVVRLEGHVSRIDE